MVVFRDDEDQSIGSRYGGRELAVLERFTGIIDRERNLPNINQLGLDSGIFRISISSVWISPRFDTSPKTKLAAGSLKRPWRAVPRTTGMKTGRVASCVAMLGFVGVI